MRGVYTVNYKISGVTTAQTLAYLTAPSTAVVEILGCSVTDANNATNQQMEVALQRITTLGTPTAASFTPAPTEPGDQAAASTVKVNVTASEPTYPSSDPFKRLWHEGDASVGGAYFDPVPEERPVVAPSASVGLRLLGTITSTDLVISIAFREIG